MSDLYMETIYGNMNHSYVDKLCAYLYMRLSGKDMPTAEEESILDVGCGKGSHMDAFKKLGLKVSGIDLRPAKPDIISCNFETEKIPFPSNSFDYAYCKSVIEHLKEVDRLIREVKRILKPGGKAVFLVPDWKSQMSHYWDDYTHVRAWTRKSLMNCLYIHGYNPVSCEKFYQLPFLWRRPWLKVIPVILSVVPQAWKWKDDTMSNGKDRKLIRFSKELMLLAMGKKPE